MNNYFRSVTFGLLFSALLFLGTCEDESSSISFLALGDSYTIGESVDLGGRCKLTRCAVAIFELNNPQ